MFRSYFAAMTAMVLCAGVPAQSVLVPIFLRSDTRPLVVEYDFSDPAIPEDMDGVFVKVEFFTEDGQIISWYLWLRRGEETTIKVPDEVGVHGEVWVTDGLHGAPWGALLWYDRVEAFTEHR